MNEKIYEEISLLDSHFLIEVRPPYSKAGNITEQILEILKKHQTRDVKIAVGNIIDYLQNNHNISIEDCIEWSKKWQNVNQISF